VSARRGWPVALAAASAAFAVVALGLQRLAWPLLVLACVAVATLLVALRVMPLRAATVRGRLRHRDRLQTDQFVGPV
jgi:hypothetical protein